MVDAQELHSLSRWCGSRALSWLPGRAENGEPAILLRSRAGRRGWSDMLLVADADEISLVDGSGQTIATASDVLALLDALDAGLWCPVLIDVPPPYMARSSAALWNRSGSAST